MGYLEKYEIANFVKTIQSEKSIGTDNLKENGPKISIITASYNQADYIERTILSVINQNYSNYEFIIIDGGSTDKSVEIIKKYENYLSYWVSENNNGQAEAINKGLKMATGDLLCFQNSDDLFYPNCFQKLAQFYLQKPHYDGYFGDLIFIDTSDKISEVIKTSDFNIKSQILEGVQIFNQSFFFKKSILEKWGYLDESLKFVIDYENVLRWANKGAKFVKVPAMFGAFRTHELAKTSNLQSIRAYEHELTREKYLKMYFENSKLSKLTYFKLRLDKLFFFIKKLDFQYILYRFSIKN